MWHYRDTNGSHSADIEYGDLVKSNYRAGWKGWVYAQQPVGGLIFIHVMIDRHGNELSKPFDKILHIDWIELVARARKVFYNGRRIGSLWFDSPGATFRYCVENYDCKKVQGSCACLDTCLEKIRALYPKEYRDLVRLI